MSNTEKLREFKITTSALKNSNTVYLVIIILIISGLMAYRNMPKEMFPDASFPMVLVQTIYPGNSPADIENLVTRPLEKEIEAISGIKSIESNSLQDNSMIFVKFNTNVDTEDGLKDVKEAVDKAKADLPDDLPVDPLVTDIDVSEFPCVNINLSGDFSIPELKKYAEYIEDRVEKVPQVSKIKISGVEERMVRLLLDKNKLEAYQLTFRDIENTIASENISVSAGDIDAGGIKQTVRTDGEFKSMAELENVVIKSKNNKIIYLKDVLKDSKAIDGFDDRLSISRLNDEPVVSLQVIKKSGENLIYAVEQITEILEQVKKEKTIPENLKITITNDQSEKVKNMIKNLENNIIMGVLFVMIVLFFFMGTRNAIFVGIAIPMSMLISFLILSMMGATINMMVLFALILALGMLVDNSIVAIENIHRFLEKGYSNYKAVKLAVGEIAWPIIASTATTLAAFIPLALWPGMIGKFMKYLPITLIVVLSSSLFVALIISPVIAKSFALKEERKPKKKQSFIITTIALFLAIIFYIMQYFTVANLLAAVAVVTALNILIFFDISVWFREKMLVKLEILYLKLLQFSLYKRRPYMLLVATIILMFGSIAFYFMSGPKVDFFPENEPNYIVVKVDLPVGVNLDVTDSTMNIIEADIKEVLRQNDYQFMVESMLTNIGKGAVGVQEFAKGNTPNRGVTIINFIDYEFRKGISSGEVRKVLSDELLDKYPGLKITVEKNPMGPASGKPVNIEVSGPEFEPLVALTDSLRMIIDKANIEGLQGLDLDLNTGAPGIMIDIDREKARRFGLSTGQIASTIRTALFGKEISDFKQGEDEYPIKMQLDKGYRNDITTLLNQVISFRNNKGIYVNIPISAVAEFHFNSSFEAINRINGKRVITIFSDLKEGVNANVVNRQVREILADVNMPEGYSFEFTGEQKEQKESGEFLLKALFLAVGLILIIMVTQFNSIVKPFIIIASVIFSTIGVFGGLATFRMHFIVIMTGIGIISLAGVVVNNAIVLIDYIDYLKNKRKAELNLGREDNLPIDEIKDIIVMAGQTRLRPVLLTAITTILGLVPMAIGLNIDFEGLLSNFQPDIYFGGDNAVFWGPMAWTVIFGLTFATFLTLIMVPVMYLIANKIKLHIFKVKE